MRRSQRRGTGIETRILHFFYCTRSRLWLSGKKPLRQRGAPGSIPGLACCSIGAVGSALVLCAGGRGFEPLMEHFFLGLRYGVDRPVQHGWVAEWSKALVLGTSLFGGVGSNPTPVIIFVSQISTVAVAPADPRIVTSPRSSDGRAQDS